MNGPLRNQQPLERVALINEYIAHGWKLCEIPPGTKGPTSKGWNRPENALQAGMQGMPEGVGLMHAYSGTASLDIDALEGARLWLRERGIDLQALLDADDAVQIVSGREGSAKLLYALPFPMQSKKIVVAKKTLLELRCGTANGLSVQDCLPPTVHPTSGNSYQWTGKGNWKQLPPIPAELLNVWCDLLNKDAERNIPVKDSNTPASVDELTSALYAVSPDCNRQTWVECGMALATVGEELFPLWDEWSQQSVKYPGQREALKQWVSFKPLPGGIGVGSLFFHAFAAGWQRPVPAGMFGPVPQPAAPAPVPANIESLLVSGVPYPKLDMSILPPVLSATAAMVAANVGCDPAVSVASGLVAVCTAADSRSTLKVKNGMHVLPILRLAPVGTPADTKTHGSRPMFAPIKMLETEHRSKHEAEMMAWLGQEARRAAQEAAFKKWAASPEAQLPNAVPPAVDPLPPQPKRLRLTTNDSSSAKAISLLADRPYGMTYILDDGSEWLESLANPNRYDSKTVWLQTDEGGPYNVDRMGSGETYLPNAALSMYLHLHPDTLYKLRDKLSGDGTMQRLIPIPLDTSLTTPGGEPAGYDDALKAWENALRVVFAVGVKQFEFDAEASVLWQSFKVEMTELKKKLQACGYSTYLVGFTGKLDGRAARLAFAFHLLTDPHSSQVSAKTLQNAIAFARYAFQCAAFVDGAHMDFDSVDKWVVNHILILAGNVKTVSMSDLLRSGRRLFHNMPRAVAEDSIRSAMGLLCAVGWCWPHQEHPRFPIWAINPSIAEKFASRREGLIRARVELREKISGGKV